MLPGNPPTAPSEAKPGSPARIDAPFTLAVQTPHVAWDKPSAGPPVHAEGLSQADRKSTRLNSSHGYISYAVFCLKKKKNNLGRETPYIFGRLQGFLAI